MHARGTSTILATALIAASALLSPNAVSAAVFYDFTGTCETDCSRFALDDGAAFSFSKALGLADGTDTSAGSRTVQIEHFRIFGLDFTPLSAPLAIFSDGGVIEGLLTGPSDDGNLFCYDVPGLTCDAGRFDTVVPAAGRSFAAGRDGHGPAAFHLHAEAAVVPEPFTPALLGLGLMLLGLRQRTALAA